MNIRTHTLLTVVVGFCGDKKATSCPEDVGGENTEEPDVRTV